MEEQKQNEGVVSNVAEVTGVKGLTAPTPAQPEIPKLTPEETQQNMLQLKVDSDAKVKVKIVRPVEGAEGLTEAFECSRNSILLGNELARRFGPPTDALKAIQVEITIKGKIPDNDIPTGKDVEVVMFGGTAADVMATLAHRSVSPQEAVIALRRFMSEMSELSDMKGCIVTALFEGDGVGGFSMVNQTVNVQPNHLITLAMAAKGHAEKFADDLKKSGVTLPDDKNRIVTPGSSDFKIPQGPALTMIKGGKD